MVKECFLCRKEFEKPVNCGLFEWENVRKFCSVKCSNKWKVGKPSGAKGTKKPSITGENHYAWKGDDVGYGSLHSWIIRELGKPDTCEMCKKTGLTGNKIQWASKSRKYKRDLDDWIRLCSKCHSIHDEKLGVRNSKRTEFKKGHVPWHKGTKGKIKAPKSAFKKGNIPWNKGRSV